MKKLSLSLIFLIISSGHTQDDAPRQFIFLDDWSYELMDYWINNGSLSLPFVLNQPYTIGDVKRSLHVNIDWTRLIERYYKNFYAQPGFARSFFTGASMARWFQTATCRCEKVCGRLRLTMFFSSTIAARTTTIWQRR